MKTNLTEQKIEFTREFTIVETKEATLKEILEIPNTEESREIEDQIFKLEKGFSLIVSFGSMAKRITIRKEKGYAEYDLIEFYARQNKYSPTTEQIIKMIETVIEQTDN